MRRTLTLTTVAMVAALPLAAQLPHRQSFDFGASRTDGAATVAVAWGHQFGFFERLWVGYGVRGASYNLASRAFTLREGAGSGSATLGEPRVMSLNLTVGADLKVMSRLELGFNLDVVGYSSGDQRNDGTTVSAPQEFNAFAGSPADDRGTLSSEFYATIGLDQQLSLRGGIAHYVVGMDAGSPGGATARYNDAITAPFLSLRWRF